MWILLTHVTVYTALSFKFFVCKLKFVFLVMACKTRAWKAGCSRGVNFTTLQEINGFLASQMHVIYSKIYTLLVLARWDNYLFLSSTATNHIMPQWQNLHVLIPCRRKCSQSDYRKAVICSLVRHPTFSLCATCISWWLCWPPYFP